MVHLLRYNRDLWDVYFIDPIVVKKGVGDDVVVDTPQDWEHEKSDGEAEEDDRDELNDEIEYAQRLSEDPLPIMEDASSGRGNRDDHTSSILRG